MSIISLLICKINPQNRRKGHSGTLPLCMQLLALPIILVLIATQVNAAIPSTPDLSNASDTGVSNTDNITRNATPTFTGTASANLKVTISSDISGKLGSTTADGAGVWAFTPTKNMRSVTHQITATETDNAGVVSAPSPALAVTIDFSSAAIFPAAIDLSIFPADQGFTLNGVAADDRSGASVSDVGDFNNDGIDDFLIGAASFFGSNNPSQAYVVFGTDAGFPQTLELSSLNGVNGVKLVGGAGAENTGFSVHRAGDFNDDGIDDVIIGALRATPAVGRTAAGQAFVVFGSNAAFGPTLDLQALNGTNGIILNGVTANDNAGLVVSGAGDINNDGIDDVIIGAPNADVNGNVNSGQVYTVFGANAGLTSPIELSSLDGTNGFTFSGTPLQNQIGDFVSALGDFNDDGIDDLGIGSPATGANGEVYILYGSGTPFAAALNSASLDGTNGFIITDDGSGNNPIGRTIDGAGDFNHDGVTDIILGANGFFQPRVYYVIYGTTTPFTNPFSLVGIDGTNGVTMSGSDSHDQNLLPSSGAGDVNGDAIDDVILARADSTGGQAQVVFGRAGGPPSPIDLTALDGTNGFILNTVPTTNFGGLSSVSAAGDVNNDGIGDAIIGAPIANPNSINAAGQTHVVFGKFTSPKPGITSITRQTPTTTNLAAGTTSAVFRVTFSENLAGTLVDATDFALAAGGTTGTVSAVTQVSASVYDVTVNSLADAGTLDLDIAVGHNLQDPAGNFLMDTNPGSEESYFLLAGPTTLFSSVLPSARSGSFGGVPDAPDISRPAAIGDPITVFASVINAGTNPGQNCRVSIPPSAPVSLSYQLTDAGNVPVGPADAVFDLAAGQTRSFILAFTPTRTSPGEDVFPNFVCDNANVDAIPGVNTVFLTIGSVEGPDILSIGATPSADGIITVPSGSAGFMTASAINIGAGDAVGSADAAVIVSADTGAAALSLLIQFCETNAASVCITTLGTDPVSTVIGDSPGFFAVFVTDQTSGAGISLDPANARVFLRFKNAAGTNLSVTSAAITVPAPADAPTIASTLPNGG